MTAQVTAAQVADAVLAAAREVRWPGGDRVIDVDEQILARHFIPAVHRHLQVSAIAESRTSG